MEIAPDNLIYHELIGLPVQVVDAANPSLIGIGGRVVDETRNTLVIEEDEVERRVPKDVATLVFTIPDGRRVKVSGSLLLSQPEDRIQNKFKRR